MFDKIYELADKIEKGSTAELDERARSCRTTKDAVVEVKSRLDSVRTQLSEAWQSGTGEMALADLDAFRMNREKQAEDFENTARSFEVVRDALEKAQREARNKREEAKALQAELEKAWQGAEKNPLKVPGAWAEEAKAKAQALLLLADMHRIVLTYDKVLNDEGATIRGMKGQVDEDAGADVRAARARHAGGIGYLSHILDVARKDPNLAKSMLTDKAMEMPWFADIASEHFGFEYNKDGDFYTTGEHSIQRYLGWHDFYDNLEPLIGAHLDRTGSEEHPNIEFTDQETGKEYRLELWKGQYGAGGAFGGEVGLYTREAGVHPNEVLGKIPGFDSSGVGGLLEKIPGYNSIEVRNGAENIPGFFSTAENDEQIRVTQQIYDKGNPDHVYFTNDGEGAEGTDKRHYWNLGIRTDPNVDASEIGQRATLHVENENVRNEMFRAMQEYAKSDTSFEPTMNPDGSISYDWKK